MKTSKQGLIFLASLEGIGLTKYKDSVGVWTIGIGATKSEIKDLDKWPMDKSITVEEAFDLLKSGITKYEDALNKYLKVDIQQTQFDALVSWCYNVGTGWVSKASVIKLLNSSCKESNLLYNALMMFDKPPEIVGRRKKEANLLATGRYPSDMSVSVFPVSAKGYPQYAKAKQINAEEYL